MKGNVSQPRWLDRRHYSKHLQQEAELKEVYSYERKEKERKRKRKRERERAARGQEEANTGRKRGKTPEIE